MSSRLCFKKKLNQKHSYDTVVQDQTVVWSWSILLVLPCRFSHRRSGLRRPLVTKLGECVQVLMFVCLFVYSTPR